MSFRSPFLVVCVALTGMVFSGGCSSNEDGPKDKSSEKRVKRKVI